MNILDVIDSLLRCMFGSSIYVVYALLAFCVSLGIYKFVKDWLPF